MQFRQEKEHALLKEVNGEIDLFDPSYEHVFDMLHIGIQVLLSHLI